MSLLKNVLLIAITILICVVLPQDGAHAQQRDVPYWASLRYDEVRMRVGPSQEYPIEWVYKRKGLPVKVIRVREAWRLVEDHEGTRGWIASSQLTPVRGAVIVGEGLAELREEADNASTIRWRAQPGVVGQINICEQGWCEIDVSGRTGWVLQNRLWGGGRP